MKKQERERKKRLREVGQKKLQYADQEHSGK